MTLRLTRAQVREIDRRATADYGIPSIVLMENAARGAADVAMEMLGGINTPGAVILCGGGNNGGDGYAIGRHLHNRGVKITVVVAIDPSKYKGDAAINFTIAQRIPLFLTTPNDADLTLYLTSNHLLIDALFGIGLESPPRDASLIDRINLHRHRVLAIDLPSGLDCDTGLPLGPCVKATRTVTFVAEKAGFANPISREYTGAITVADIGVPPELIADVSART